MVADITKYRVQSYFIYDGLGIAQPLFDGYGITFLGYLFTHQSSFCYLEKNGGEIVILKNDPDIFSMFAWGKAVVYQMPQEVCSSNKDTKFKLYIIIEIAFFGCFIQFKKQTVILIAFIEQTSSNNTSKRGKKSN